jgi:signal transduction histidine kinase
VDDLPKVETPRGDRLNATVLELARSVLGDLDVDRVLYRVLEAASELTGARYAALGVLDESRQALARFLTLGVDEPTRQAIGPLPTGRGVLGELIRNPTPLRVADVGSHPRSYGFPVGHPPMGCFLGVPVLIEGVAYGNLYLTDKQGAAEFTQEDEDALVLLAEFAGVAIDHARRFSGSETRREELEQTVAALDATIQIARAVGGQTDLDAIVELVAKRGRALVSARAVVIEYLRDGELVVAAVAGEAPEGLLGARVDLRDSVASAAMRTLRTQRLEHEPNRRRFEQHGLGRFGFHASAGLVVPLSFRGQPHGVLIAIERLENGPAFTADDERLLEGFSASAATAVATAQAVAAQRRSQRLAATEQERARWARELHDETLQGLAALRLGLSAALRGGDSEQLGIAARNAVEQLQTEISNLRSLITDLRPAALDQLGLEPAIDALVARVRGQGLEVDASIELASENEHAGGRLLAELETGVYRIIQEALNNARKHGDATRAVVEVQETDEAIDVAVRDNGKGFDPTARTEGFGVVGMRERVELLGGTIRFDSTPGKGTTVTATFPVRRSVAPEGLRDTSAG